MPQYSVDSRTIENVIGYIKDGQISIPEIQIPFVWDGSKIRDLIDSLYHGYPVGYLIVWQNPNMKDKLGNTTIGKKIMIDGQQRVTAIMTAIVGLKVLDQNFNERVYKIAFNPYATGTDSCFEVQSAAILKDKKWIPDISVLFKTDFDQFTFIDEYCTLNPDMPRKDLNALINRVTNIKMLLSVLSTLAMVCPLMRLQRYLSASIVRGSHSLRQTSLCQPLQQMKCMAVICSERLLIISVTLDRTMSLSSR